MNINTQYFGVVSYLEEELIHFPDGLFGFPEQKDYLPLAFDKESDALLCLQSIDEREISFILMNPFLLLPDYSPALPDEDKRLLNCGREEDLVSYYVICVMHDSINESTVNLKSPIVVNTRTREARQVILDNPKYQFRHPIKEFVKKEE